MKLESLKKRTIAFDPATVPNPFDVFPIASAQCLELLENDKWTGINTTAGDSVFITEAEAGGRWNCGKQGCQPDRCPHPKCEKCIAANKKKFWTFVKQKRDNNAGRGNCDGCGGRGGRGGRK